MISDTLSAGVAGMIPGFRIAPLTNTLKVRIFRSDKETDGVFNTFITSVLTKVSASKRDKPPILMAPIPGMMILPSGETGMSIWEGTSGLYRIGAMKTVKISFGPRIY